MFVLHRLCLSTAAQHTRANITALVDGALLQANSQPSKADRNNEEWGNKPMHFRLKKGEPLNFANAWRIHQLQYFVDETSRSSTAAFSPQATERPYHSDELQKDFKSPAHPLLRRRHRRPIAALHSLHALRVTMACALLAHKRTDGRIQAIYRWKSPASLRVYAEMTADEANLVTSTDGSRYATAPRPVTGPEDVANELDHAETELARAIRAERRRPPKTTNHTTAVDVGQGEVTGYLHDTWKLVGTVISVPNEFWELPSGSSPCRITALIEAACNNAYDYTIAFEDADNVHYRMCAKQVKHLAPKQLKKNAKGTMPTPIERAT